MCENKGQFTLNENWNRKLIESATATWKEEKANKVQRTIARCLWMCHVQILHTVVVACTYYIKAVHILWIDCYAIVIRLCFICAHSIRGRSVRTQQKVRQIEWEMYTRISGMCFICLPTLQYQNNAVAEQTIAKVMSLNEHTQQRHSVAWQWEWKLRKIYVSETRMKQDERAQHSTWNENGTKKRETRKTDEIFHFITCQFADAILFNLFLSKMFVRSLNIKCMISLHILIVERWNQRNTLQYQFVWLIVAKRERICYCAYWQMIGFYELVKLAIDSFLLGRPICARTLANGVSYQIRQMFHGTLSWCYMLSQIWI